MKTKIKTIYYLPKWEKLEVNWDEIKKELKDTPGCLEYERYRERVRLRLHVDGNVLDYPRLGGGVENNSYSLFEYINKYKREKKLPTLSRTFTIDNWVISSHIGGKITYTVQLTIWIIDYCISANKPWKIVEDQEFVPPLQEIKSNYKCKCGFHDWEQFDDVPRTQYALVFFKQTLQQSLFRCKRCGLKQVYHKIRSFSNENYSGWVKSDPELNKDATPYLATEPIEKN